MFLGIDIGTSAVKAIVIDGAGTLRASASAGLGVLRPREGWSEQRAVEWLRAAFAAGREAAAQAGGDVRGISFSGQMHGSVFLSKESVGAAGSVEIDALRPALLWNDQRTGTECAEIERAMGGRPALVQAAGNAALPGFTLPKVLWVRRHEPRIFAETARVLTPKDFVRLAMTGEACIDAGDASGTLLLDVERRDWRDATFAAVGLDRALLPPVVESGAACGTLTAWAAEQLGVAAGVPVYAGSGDNMMGAVGAGVVSPGQVLATLGTSGVVYAHADRPRRDLNPDTPGRLQTMCAATGSEQRPGGWCVTGCMLSAAGSLHWARETIAPGVAFDTLLHEAEGAPPGCEGLVFLPYLTGERCPYPDPTLRGGWIGLTARHTRGHLVRSVLEGVAFGMSQMLSLVRGLGVPVASVRVGGGGSKSPLWRRVQADVCGETLEVLNADEGPAFGAALLAAVGCGAFSSLGEACGATLKVVERVELSRERDRYGEARALYEALYPALSPLFRGRQGAAS